MSLDNLDDSLKVIVVGDGNVGKTSMLRRYVKGVFTEQYKKTIGAEYLEKEIFLKDLKQSVTLMLWDTAGQEVFNALTAAYYRGSAACIFAFSTIDRDSFMNVVNWKKKVEAQCGNSIVMVICQTKFDLVKEAAVTNEEAEKLAAHLKLPFYRISTKDDYNVTGLFEFVAKQCLVAGTGGNEGAVASVHAPPTSASATAASSSSAGGKGKDDDSKKDATSSSSKKDKKDKKGHDSGSDGSDSDSDDSGSKKKDKKDKDKKEKDKDKKEKDKDKKEKDKDKKEKDKDKEKKDKDKKDKKEKDDDAPGGQGKDGVNTKPINMRETKKKDKKEKKGGKCVSM